jgi:phosphoribosyl-ATP pyrophosphohydrolase/phosphoribosyl-AMP cyclohydrolase
MLIPSIHLVKGRAVRLREGQELEFVSDADPRELAARFGRVGEIAVIDLDAARGTGDNLTLVEELCGLALCRVGGGIRDVKRAERLLRAGARKLIIGTAAEPAFLSQFNPARLVAAVDARDDQVVDHGWTAAHGENPIARARRLEPYVAGFLYTLVERDGTESGTDLERVQQLARAVGRPVTAAGGIRSLDEITTLDRMGVDAQVGMALYRGTLGLGESLATVVDFVGGGGLVPTIVQDVRDGRVLMVAHSSRDTLIEAIEAGETLLHTRRKGRWQKGESAGGTQRLLRVEVDCDRDALLFLVEATGPACHRGTASCFGDRPFSLARLEEAIAAQAADGDGDSYTGRLLGDAVARRAKIMEEANELVEARRTDAIRREAADLLFHLLVELRARRIPVAAVLAELESRRRRSS